ncbi:MAG TPA: N-acetylmuramoyl-L-alanine amidase [Gemmatimonadaceae bacterium]|jgi:N-acetylmuramoyl-L-alanine amidase|nr:N-acetylmuramoyl-L-alanine amidase [Gemmatimonadaceae bacterium]
MILAALAAFQLAAAAPPALGVRSGQQVVRIPTVAGPDGRLVRLSALDEMIPLNVRRDSANWYSVEAWGARFQLHVGSNLVRANGSVRQLASAPVLRNGELFVPVQLVSDVFPVLLPNNRWDADSAQLVLMSLAPASAPRPAPAPRAAAPVPVPQQQGGEVARNAAHDAEREAEVARANARAGGPLPPIAAKTSRRRIIVDAGHGGIDDGMTGPIGGGPRIYEKNITLSVAMRLGAQLKSRGLDVVYTRTTDTLIALDDRGHIANKAQGDLFISVHVNAANPNWKDPGASRGFETYFLSEARTEDARRVEQMENDAARFETVHDPIDSNDPVGFILSDMQQNEHLRESSELADIIQEHLGVMHPGPSRGVKQAGFRVLVTAYMPAVLVEIGFGTNAKEAQFLSDPDKQNAIAAAIADAATEYLERYESRVHGTPAGVKGRER